MRIAIAFAVVLGLLFTGALPRLAAAKNTAANTVKEALSKQDKDFFKDAAQVGLAGVEISQSVRDPVMDNDVKNLAQRIIDEQGKVNTQLTSLAQSKALTLPTDMTDAQKDMKQRLTQLNGYELERRYVQDMINENEKAVQTFQKEWDHGQDADVKKFAQDTLPTWRDHLSRAKTVEQKLKKMQTSQKPPQTY